LGLRGSTSGRENDAGLWAIDLPDSVSSKQAYVPNTPMLATRLYDRHGGAVEITDFAPLFETMLACRNAHGLLAEHIDPRTRELWGNFVQTYSMVGLINSAVRLSTPWEEAF